MILKMKELNEIIPFNISTWDHRNTKFEIIYENEQTHILNQEALKFDLPKKYFIGFVNRDNEMLYV